MLLFANGSWEVRAELAGEFEDQRLNELSSRLICEYAGSLVPRYQMKRYENWVRGVFSGKDECDRRSIDSAIAELETLPDEYPNRMSEIKDIRHYIRKLADQLG